MPSPIGSIRIPSHSLAWVMTLIAIIAADLAALRAILPRIPNAGLVITILVLEVELFRMVSRRGEALAFWLGFEIAGWAYVSTCEFFAWIAWRLARLGFEGSILGRPIGLPTEMNQFVLFAGIVQLLISLAVALLAGFLTRSAWRRRGEIRHRPEGDIGRSFSPVMTWAVLAAVALSSCGKADRQATDSALKPVSGQVRVDGKPAADVEVRLFPLNRNHDADAPRPHAKTDKEGRFQLRTGADNEGAPVGQYLATLTWPAGRGGADRLGGAFAEPDGSGLTVVIDETTTEIPPFEISAGRRGRSH